MVSASKPNFVVTFTYLESYFTIILYAYCCNFKIYTIFRFTNSTSSQSFGLFHTMLCPLPGFYKEWYCTYCKHTNSQVRFQSFSCLITKCHYNNIWKRKSIIPGMLTIVNRQVEDVKNQDQQIRFRRKSTFTNTLRMSVKR